jgi:hypothetical protein
VFESYCAGISKARQSKSQVRMIYILLVFRIPKSVLIPAEVR